MATVDEVRASMHQMAERATQSLGALQQAHDIIEEARAGVVQIAQSSAQETAQEAIALLSKAMADVLEVQRTVQAATQTSQGYASGL